MIFKRPNAFIIKHLKLIHAIILVCLVYTLIKTSNISNTYNHIIKVKSIIGETYATELYNVFMFIVLIIALILAMIILTLLIKKKKKTLFYILLIVLLAGTLVFYIMSYGNIITMEKKAISATTYLAYNDICKILFYVQSVFVFIVLFKATGFDIKSFSFGKVSGIDLTEADSEEVEFNLELDGNELKTKQRRKIRELKYKYLENKVKIKLIAVIILLLVSIITFATINSKKQAFLNVGKELQTQKYSVIVKDAYLTNVDKYGKEVAEGFFIILDIKLKKNVDSEYKFNYSKIAIKIGDKTIYANPKYFDYFSDFGEAYKEQNLTKDYADYYLAYQLPYEFSTTELYIMVSNDFDYKLNKYNYFIIKTNYQRLDKITETVQNYYLKDKMEINAYGIKSNIIVEEAQFLDKYKISVNEEIQGKNYELVEYLVPTADDNEEKTIMKINYKSDYDANLSAILLKYGIIEYEIDNVRKEGNLYTFLSPKLLKEPNVFYIQVSKSVLEGTKRTIKIKIRNCIYKYHLNYKEDL